MKIDPVVDELTVIWPGGWQQSYNSLYNSIAATFSGEFTTPIALLLASAQSPPKLNIVF